MRKPRYRKVFSILVILAGCSSVESSTSQSSGSVQSTTFATSVPSSTASSVDVPRGPAQARLELERNPNLKHVSDVIAHKCGDFVFVQSADTTSISIWDGSDWLAADSQVNPIQVDPDTVVNSLWIEDVTEDLEPEIIVSWLVPGANRTFGQIISASDPDCEWNYISQVGGCGTSTTFDDLEYYNSNYFVVGTGFTDCAEGRTDVNFLWDRRFSRFVTGAVAPNPFCYTFREDFDLPLRNCSEGWAVQMAQEAIATAGISVDTDGRFGPGTSDAVLLYQQRKNLPLSGEVDFLTWSIMYPVGSEVSSDGWDYYPDYDGDGVSSPREIGHASGAFEYVDSTPYQGPPRASRPKEIRRYCESRQSGLISNMRGPRIDYTLVIEYSNGFVERRMVGSSWDNFFNSNPCT